MIEKLNTGNKAVIGSVVFILLCAVGLTFSDNSPFWDSLYYVREHLFIIGLLWLLSEYVYESFQLTLIYGLIIYKIELVIFNIFLAFLPREKWLEISGSYDIAVKFTLSLWILLFIVYVIRKWL